MLNWSGQKKMKGKIISSSIFSIALILMAVYIGEFNSYLYAFIGCAGMWGMTHVSWANEKLKVKNEALKSENATLIQQQQKSLDEIDTLRQKYSRTNQPRSGGKFVKKDIIAGEKYLCTKDVAMVDYIAFSSGKVYASQHDRCITNNNNNEWHSMGHDFCKHHFKLLHP